MCGIYCYYAQYSDSCLEHNYTHLHQCHHLKNKRLLNRGPDYQDSKIYNFKDKNLILSGYVLHIQGERICHQPLQYKQGSLLFNGQIFCKAENAKKSDTEYFLELIQTYGVIEACRGITGPYSIIYLDNETKQLWFGRDFYGRRSLLIHQHDDELSISSVRPNNKGFIEVPAIGMFCFNLETDQLESYLYDNAKDSDIEMYKMFKNIHSHHGSLPLPVAPLNTDLEIKCDVDETVDQFLLLLSKSVERRNTCCVYPLHFTQATRDGYLERHCYCSDGTCTAHTITQCKASGSRVGVLFSGGVDCTLIALLLHRCAPIEESIDLLNVAFGKTSAAPDRLSAHSSLEELREACPGRVWNLVEINITLVELQSSRKKYIADLVYPHTSVLDDSIGCALWFAARGVGVMENKDNIYSTARLLFSGIGADELMGGYSRHRSAFERGGLHNVVQEIALDIDRISSRNLGRDNRVIGDHHRDCVAPFLDFDFVNFINSVPITVKVDFTLPRGEGEKWILRKAACSVGLYTSSKLPKRAIQFGSKIAKLEGKKEKGRDVCQRLL